MDYQKDIEYIKDTTDDDREHLLSIPGVIGTGLTLNSVTGVDVKNQQKNQKKHQIVVYLDKYNSEIKSQIPKYINGIRLVKNFSGDFQASSFWVNKIRPLRSGISVGKIDNRFGGTIAGFPIDMSHEGLLPDGTRRRILLSCNHVIASDWGCRKDAKKGDIIIQPSKNIEKKVNEYEELNEIGKLERWIRVDGKLVTNGPITEILPPNYIDGAIATIDPGIEFNDINMCNYYSNNYIDPIPGTFVKKVGPYSKCGFENYIHSIDADIILHFIGNPYGSFHSAARFVDQIVIAGSYKNPACIYGDSGSLVIHADTNNAIGMMIGGTQNSLIRNSYTIPVNIPGGSYMTWTGQNDQVLPAGFGIANKIDHIQNLLQISFGQKYQSPIPQPSHRVCCINMNVPMCLLERGEGIHECPQNDPPNLGDENKDYYQNHICNSKRVTIRLRLPAVKAIHARIDSYLYSPYLSGFYMGNRARTDESDGISPIDITFNNFDLGELIDIKIVALGQPDPVAFQVCYDGQCYNHHDIRSKRIILIKNNYDIVVKSDIV